MARKRPDLCRDLLGIKGRDHAVEDDVSLLPLAQKKRGVKSSLVIGKEFVQKKATADNGWFPEEISYGQRKKKRRNKVENLRERGLVFYGLVKGLLDHLHDQKE